MAVVVCRVRMLCRRRVPPTTTSNAYDRPLSKVKSTATDKRLGSALLARSARELGLELPACGVVNLALIAPPPTAAELAAAAASAVDAADAADSDDTVGAPAPAPAPPPPRAPDAVVVVGRLEAHVSVT